MATTTNKAMMVDNKRVLDTQESHVDSSRSCIFLDNIRKVYGSTVALDGLSIDIPQGEKYALIGPNGAGKSTTLKLLVGLLKPDSGQITIMGHDPTSMDAKRLIGYLPEDASPYATLSVRENLEYVGALRGVDNLEERVSGLLGELSLSEYEKSKVGKLSRGNRQKLAVALAIIHQPKVILLDEPLNYLDIPTQEKVVGMLERLNATVLVSTHIMSIAERLTDGAIVISRGKNVWSGSMAELQAQAHPTESIESVVVRLMTGVG